jgi:hypothetical protein
MSDSLKPLLPLCASICPLALVQFAAAKPSRFDVLLLMSFSWCFSISSSVFVIGVNNASGGAGQTLHGTQDHVHTLFKCFRMQRLVPNAKFQKIPNAPHLFKGSGGAPLSKGYNHPF